MLKELDMLPHYDAYASFIDLESGLLHKQAEREAQASAAIAARQACPLRMENRTTGMQSPILDDQTCPSYDQVDQRVPAETSKTILARAGSLMQRFSPLRHGRVGKSYT